MMIMKIKFLYLNFKIDENKVHRKDKRKSKNNTKTRLKLLDTNNEGT